MSRRTTQPWGAPVVFSSPVVPESRAPPTSQLRLPGKRLSRQGGARGPGWRRRCHPSRAGKIEAPSAGIRSCPVLLVSPAHHRAASPRFSAALKPNRSCSSSAVRHGISVLQVQTRQRHLHTSQRSGRAGELPFRAQYKQQPHR